MNAKLLGAAMAVLCASSSLFAFDGIGAAIIYKVANPDYRIQANTFRLVVSHVVNSAVTRQDTIYRDGTFDFSTISPDGQRIAFYKDDAGVCVIDVNGSNFRVVARTVNWGFPDKEQSIAWPGIDGGQWLYYHRPCSDNCNLSGSGEIWKVNVNDTAQKVMVCDYKKLNQRINMNEIPPVMLKYSLSTDARYAVVHTNGSTASLGYNIGIIPHTFPPQCDPGTTQINPWLTKPSCEPGCAINGACNSGLSAGGNIVWHFDGGHVRVYSWKWDHVAKTTVRYPTGTPQNGAHCVDMYLDMEKWLPAGTPFDYAGVVYPRGGCNSDQILTVQLEWSYGASHVGNGGDMIVVDWKEKKACLITNNPSVIPPGKTNADNAGPFWNVDPADFWKSGGPAGCFQNLNNEAVNIQTGAVVGPWGSTGAVRSAGATSLTVSRGHAVDVYNLNGTRLSRSGRIGTGTARGLLIAVDHSSGRAVRSIAIDNNEVP